MFLYFLVDFYKAYARAFIRQEMYLLAMTDTDINLQNNDNDFQAFGQLLFTKIFECIYQIWYVQKGLKRKQKFLSGFGVNLRKIRDEKSLSQQKLADISDLSKTYILNLELGRSYPTIETLWMLSEALEIEVIELLNYKY